MRSLIVCALFANYWQIIERNRLGIPTSVFFMRKELKVRAWCSDKLGLRQPNSINIVCSHMTGFMEAYYFKYRIVLGRQVKYLHVGRYFSRHNGYFGRR